jgi:Family of unknown function (DUF6263)
MISTDHPQQIKKYVAMNPALSRFRNWLPVLSLGTTLLLTCGRGHAQEASVLEWKFREGDQFSQKLVQDSQLVSRVDVRDATQSNRMEIDVDWVVKSVDNKGQALIEQRISRVQTTIKLPGPKGGMIEYSFDSDSDVVNKESKHVADSIRPLVNQLVLVTMTSRGLITDVDIPEATLESLRKIPVTSEGVEAFSADALNELFQACGMELPEKEVRSGESWVVKKPVSVASGQQFTRETTYTLGENGQITVTSKLVPVPRTPDSAEKSDSSDGARFDPWVISDQSSSGTIEFDQEKGHARNSGMTTRLVTLTQYHGMRCTTTLTSTATSTIGRK